jgi:hypothetical protein
LSANRFDLAIARLPWFEEMKTSNLPYAARCTSPNAHAGKAVTSSELNDLLPDRWLQSHPDCVWTIDVIRRAERCQKNQARRRRPSS